MKTFTPKPADLTHDWYVIDATDVVLGRLASQAAILLRGKNKPTFAPHADSGNHVIIINADKIALTGNKMGKELYSHSGRPGGLRRDSYAELLEKNPERIIKEAVKGMLPKNRLAKVQLDRLRIFRDADHQDGRSAMVPAPPRSSRATAPVAARRLSPVSVWFRVTESGPSTAALWRSTSPPSCCSVRSTPRSFCSSSKASSTLSSSLASGIAL